MLAVNPFWYIPNSVRDIQYIMVSGWDMERRDFLKQVGAGAGIGIGVPSAGYLFSKGHTGSIRRFQELAETVDRMDLADPATDTQTLHTEIDNAIDDAEDGIGSFRTDTDRFVAGVLHWLHSLGSVLPFVSDPPAKPKIEREVGAIEQAITYYSALLEYLGSSQTVRWGLIEAETSILNGDDDIRLLGDDAIERLANNRSNLHRVDDELPQTSDSLLDDLLPERSVVREAVSQRITAFRQFSDVQGKYVFAREAIRDGATQRENHDFDAASDSFGTAQTTADVIVPKDLGDAFLSRLEFTLQEYESVLKAYRSGAAKMQASCTGEAGALDQFDAGLSHLFDVRDALVSG